MSCESCVAWWFPGPGGVQARRLPWGPHLPLACERCADHPRRQIYGAGGGTGAGLQGRRWLRWLISCWLRHWLLMWVHWTDVGWMGFSWEDHGNLILDIYRDIYHDILNMILMGVSVMRSPKKSTTKAEICRVEELVQPVQLMGNITGVFRDSDLKKGFLYGFIGIYVMNYWDL